jgi:phage shock protein C
MAHKKLYRSRKNVMIGGVCAGLAEYFNIDPSLARLATVLLVFPGGLSFWAYIIAWIIIPQRPLATALTQDTAAGSDTGTAQEEAETETKPDADKTKYVIGLVLVIIGIFFLLHNFNILVWFSFFKLWPIVLIIIGAVILLKGLNRGGDGDEG